MPAEPSIVKAVSLVPRFGSRTVTKPVNFELRVGELGILTGANGCGKTTILRAALGEVEFSGSLLILSRVPFRGRPWKTINRGVSLIPQFPVAPTYLSIREFVSAVPSSSDKPRLISTIEDLAQTSSLKLIGELSHGQRRLVEIALAISADCKLLLADEPLAALSASAARSVMRHLSSYLESGGAVLMSAHQPELRAWPEAWRAEVVAA
jgi:ABC-type multidrug transport system ATPase subunit